MISFFCKKCQLDQENFPHQINEHAYASKCGKCGGRMLRYIKDKHLDPYFRESIKLQKQRQEFSKDIIQYGDPRFEKFYKDQWDKFEQQKEAFEKEKQRKKESFEKQRASFSQRYERDAFGHLEEKLV